MLRADEISETCRDRVGDLSMNDARLEEDNDSDRQTEQAQVGVKQG